MKRGKRIALTLAMCLSMLLLAIPQQVSAYTPTFAVTINDASYADLDGDNVEDDVLVFFTCFVRADYRIQRSDFLFSLTLPSGITHYALIIVIGHYNELRLALSWYDSAWEPGWYNVQVEGYAYGIPGGYDYDAIDFDPPTGTGGGDPTISVSFWDY